MQLSRHRIGIISVIAAFCVLNTACDDDSTTARTETCTDPHCPCTVTDDCRTPSQKCYEGTCYDLSEMCGDIVCGEAQVCQDNSCVDKTEQKCGNEVCSSNQKCYQNKCHDNSEFCGDTICSGTQTCENESCVEKTEQKCGDELCKTDQRCFEGACHDNSEFCGDIICSETQTCQNGSCVEPGGENCGDEVCGNDQKCFEGACHDNSEFCGDIICGETQTCKDGSCVDQSEQKCGDEVCGNDQKCFEEACHDNSEFCGETICGEEQTCVEDQCMDNKDLCNDTVCQADEKCYQNKCYKNDEFCGDIVCEQDQTCENNVCIASVKSIEFVTTDDKLLFNEELKVDVKVLPENAKDKTVEWKVSVTGPSGVEDKVFNKQTTTLTNRTLNVREVKLTVTSTANPSVTATKTILFKPYTKAVCTLNQIGKCDKPRILHKASEYPFLPCNNGKPAYDEETTKVFNNDIYTEYVSKYLLKSGSSEFGTRASVIMAARFLTLQFPFYVRYYDNTHTVTKYSTESHYVWTNDDTKPSVAQDVRIFGLNLTPKAYNGYTCSTVVQNNVVPWSCPINPTSQQTNERNKGTNGLACCGFVSWALRNGRLYLGDWWTNIFANYGSCTVGGKKVRHYNCPDYVNGKMSTSVANPFNELENAYNKFKELKSTNQTSMCDKSTCDYKVTDSCTCDSGKCNCACITNKIGGDTKEDALNDRTDFVNVKYINEPALQKKIKAGDLLWHGRNRCTDRGGHIALILGIDRKADDTIESIYVAEAGSTDYGTVVTKYSLFFFQNCSIWSETECVKDNKGNYVIRKNNDGSVYVPNNGKPTRSYDSFIIRMDNIYNYYYKNGTVSEKGNEYKYKEIESFAVSN